MTSPRFPSVDPAGKLHAKHLPDHTHAIADLTATGTADSSTVLYGDGTWKTAPTGGLAQSVVYREFSAGAWPVRGTVPADTLVIWVKRTSTDPDPAIDGTYMLAGRDILLKAS